MRRSLLPIVLLLVGCAAQTFPPAPIAAPSPASPRPDPSAPLAPFDVQDAARALARWRGIALRSPIQVEELEPEAFRARRRSESSNGRRIPRGVDFGGFWSAYGFAAPAADLAAVARKVNDETVAGFYSSREKKLFLPKKVGGLVGNQRVLLHEIEHALQDQNYGMPDYAALPDDDIVIAQKSLYEGDAELAALEFNHDATKPPARAPLVRRARRIRTTPLDELLERDDDASKEIRSAPPLLRARLMAPYLDGLAFVADIYRAGGFKLVGEAFAHPPVSTEQVLHPEKSQVVVRERPLGDVGRRSDVRRKRVAGPPRVVGRRERARDHRALDGEHRGAPERPRLRVPRRPAAVTLPRFAYNPPVPPAPARPSTPHPTASDAAALAHALRRFEPLDDRAVKDGLAHHRVRTLARGEHFLIEGRRATEIALVVSGLLREYFLLSDGTERTKAFVTEGGFSGSLADLLSSGPSRAFIVAEEPARLLVAPYTAYRTLAARSEAWARFGRSTTNALLLRKAEREYELLALDAAGNYAAFRALYPGLETRVAARLVASYLGITPVHLSRLRRKRRQSRRSVA